MYLIVATDQTGKVFNKKVRNWSRAKETAREWKHLGMAVQIVTLKKEN